MTQRKMGREISHRNKANQRRNKTKQGNCGGDTVRQFQDDRGVIETETSAVTSKDSDSVLITWKREA